MRRMIILGCLYLFIIACNSNKQQQQTTAPADTAAKKVGGIQYTCTMHPDVLSNKPGTCPKCGMELVEKDKSK